MLTQRPCPADYPAILHQLERAFAPSVSEADLVKDLRAASKISFDFVLQENDRIVAYVCYSAAYDAAGNGIGYHLAPVAVLPGFQGKGLGKRIITESLVAVAPEQPVYVLGDPEYYGRFGFRVDKTQKCPFDPEGNHFMVLSKSALPGREVFYEEEFCA